MYYIEVGLGRRWRFLAVFFSLVGMVGCLALFQANQLAEALASSFDVPRWLTGGLALVGVGVVVLGGIERIAAVAGRIVPAMCLAYLLLALVIVAVHAAEVPRVLAQIFHDAFCGTAAAGGAAGIAWQQVVQTGIKRAAFSNEAGLGTAPMAHGAARTAEPVREGLVAMLGPFIDTIVVCTLTALVILVTGGWQLTGVQGIALTVQAFESTLGYPGRVALVVMAALFAVTTMFGYSYYGKKCFGYLFGAERARLYDWFYLVMILVGALWTADMVVNLVDTAFALMALPNMVATLLLAPKVMAAAKHYFARHRL